MGVNTFHYVIFSLMQWYVVNNETMSYETYSSSSGNGGKRLIISAKKSVSLMVYLFLQRGLK